MGSKGRIPPHMRRPLPSPGMFHSEPFGLGIHPQLGALPIDLMPPPEIMEQKLAAQHMDMQDLVVENQRLAATHSALRHELAAAQHELQRLQDHMATGKSDHEQQIRAILDKISKMESALKASEPFKVELLQARAEAQNLAAVRQELISKVQQLTQDMQKCHIDSQQIPPLLSELGALRQEYQHCRATYDYERKLRVDHYESLQVMEKNYVAMHGEVEKLRRELSNSTNIDKTSGPYGSNVGYKESDASGQYSVGQNTYEDVYRVPQGHGPSGAPAPFGGAPARAAPAAAALHGYDAAGNAAYEAPRSNVYDASTAPNYETSRASSYEPHRGFPRYEGHGAVGAQGAAAAANPAPPYAMAQPPSSYAAAAQQPSVYGAPQMQPPYGGASQNSARPASGYEPPAGGAAANQGRSHF